MYESMRDLTLWAIRKIVNQQNQNQITHLLGFAKRQNSRKRYARCARYNRNITMLFDLYWRFLKRQSAI
jgi:hypothetical protein